VTGVQTCALPISGSRHVPRAVLLAELRCDGSGHDGCQAECRLFWKEAWLRRVAPDAPPSPPFPARDMVALLERASRHVRQEGEAERPSPLWRCQNTELPRASEHLKLWHPRSYVRELTTGNVGLGRFLRVTARASVQEPMRKLGFVSDVHLPGLRREPTSDPPLDLQPGELVQVKSRAEIAATLDAQGRHRGMAFDREMLPFCGGTFRVRQRIRRFIDERSGGRMIEFRRSDCVTLDGVVCSGERSLRRWFCHREIYSYWRECWLRRVPPAAAQGPDSTA